MKLKNIVRVATLLPLTFYLLYCTYYLITTEFRPTYLDCGKVVSKSSDEISIKHGSKTELYLNIQFNKSGFRSIECDPTTYFSKQIGDIVCFNLPKRVSIWHEINQGIGIITLLILFVIIFSLFVCYLFAT